MFKMQFQTLTAVFCLVFIAKSVIKNDIFSSFVVKSNYIPNMKGLFKLAVTLTCSEKPCTSY